MSLKEACEKKIIANQMLGYFLGRIYLFMKGLGINEEMIRFRQHLSGEMAHYACDCWDTELLCSYGWVECVGLADRSAFDLTAHTVGSGVKLQASRMLKEKVTKDILTYSLNRAVIGKTFKKEAKDLITAIENLTQDSLKCVQKELETKKSSKVGTFTITDEMLTDWKTVQKTF
jgi:glycyl-tRNA synthetase